MIRLNGQEVLIPEKMGISYNLTNPHLVYDSIPSSQAQIPTFPAVRQNRAVFDYYEEPQAGSYLPELLYQHFHNGDLIREGYFLLTEASEDEGYKGAFSDKLGLFFGEYQNKFIREIDFGLLTLPEPIPAFGAVSVNDELAYCYPPVVNDFFYGSNGGSIDYGGVVNQFNKGSYIDSPKVPMFFVSWIIKQIARITGVKITGSFLDHPDWSSLILYNTRETQTEQLTIAEHLPAMTVVEFLMEIRKIANLKFDFNTVGRVLEINFWEDCLAAPTQRDWTGKATVGEKKTPELNTRIQLIMQMDGNDALVKDRPAFFADYISEETPGTNNGIAKVEMKFSTLAVDEAGLIACKQEGQSSLFGQETKSFSPRLLFWHGLVDDVPTALPGKGTISLSPTALAQTSWKETIALRKRMFYLQKSFIVNEADLARLDFSKKYHCQGVDYLLAMVNVSVPIKGTAECLLLGGV
jgi:hypothetical protein